MGKLKKGLNPMSFGYLVFVSLYLTTAFKTGEGIAVGRSFSMFKNYHIDGNNEMIATLITHRPFSRSAVNYNAGYKTALSNVVMAIAVMFTLLFLTPLFHYTCYYEAAIHLWKVDKFDFVVCMSVCIHVVFGSVEIGLFLAVARVLLFVARPRTFVRGNLPNSMVYRNINDEEGRIKSAGNGSLQYVILDTTDSIDTSGISMFEELVLANSGSEVMKKMNKSELIEKICQEWIYLTVAEAVAACNFLLHSTKPNPGKDQEPVARNNV
ncbi:hypothetical protein PRUPE_4G093900 [Prunus persica]|uniref:SLC26A/SulP transporter domain-containing protein n=1 Tax=Prunus persica TaxID=3760 RepID=M5X4N5_PRUPE|nr:hypothetical protein PRUPE_4G093900 [Prunus persica]